MHIGLTIWGSIEFFVPIKQMIVCYIELPVLSNFMFILIVAGYMVVLRVLTTVIHFKFGVRLYRWLRRTFRCFRKFDRHLR